MKDKKSNTKKSKWAFVVYPDSAPPDWIEQLQQTGLECCISPLHDKDTEPTGEVKKPHWHVIACYSGPTTFNVVKSITDSFNAPIPQPLESVKGYYRYLTHMDNPEKYQYDSNGIKNINGFSIINYSEMTKQEVSAYKKEIQEIIRNNDIVEYCDLLDLLMDNELFDLLDIAQNHTMLFNAYIKSRKYKAQESSR